MTNIFLPLGFQPVRNKSNSGAGQMGQYTISSSDGSILALNDLVKRSSGNTITKAGPGDTPVGTFQGWNWRTRSPYGGSQGMAADAYIVPWKKVWNGAVSQVNTNQYIEALVDDDPFATYKVQCFGTINQSNIGNLVDLADSLSGPDVNVMGRGMQGVGPPATYYLITSFSQSAGGSGYTQNGVDLVINGQILNINPAAVVVTAGAVASITVTNSIPTPTNSATIVVQPKPGFAGTGATFTASYGSVQTAAQFRVERIFEMPFRSQDSSYNTQGYDLSSTGLYAWVEVAYAKHARLGTALYSGT